MMGTNNHRTAWYVNGSGPVADIASARAQAQKFADRLGLKTGEVMQFANNFYVLLTDSQGKPATEVLVDPETGTVTLEYGPAMMWNTRYGMMRGTGTGGYGAMMGSGSSGGMMGGGNTSGGMMGGRGAGMDRMMGQYGGSPNWTPPSGSLSARLTASDAQRVANEWLTKQGSGLTAAQPDALPGYFTLHTLKDGKITGMLSVNEQTGAVWYPLVARPLRSDGGMSTSGPESGPGERAHLRALVVDDERPMVRIVSSLKGAFARVVSHAGGSVVLVE